MEPAITVLMPVFNGERFLGEAIESILNQTFADFELLIIDDGSTDKTIDIINSYNDDRIRLIKNEKNLGISRSLNKGIDLARAGLIARMDADDISYPERLERQYNYLAAHSDCALLSTSARVVTEDKQLIYIDKTKSEYLYYNLAFHSPIYHSTVIYRKTAVQNVGMYSVPYSEDFELFWHLSRKYKIHNLTEVLLDYRNSPQSLHQVKKKKEYDEASFAQTLRNLRFYAGENFTISESCLKCLQYDTEPLAKQNSVNNIIKCFRQLELITGKIINTDNINRDINAIKAASRFKKKYTLSLIANQLPRSRALILLLRMGAFETLLKKTADFLKRKIHTW